MAKDLIALFSLPAEMVSRIHSLAAIDLAFQSVEKIEDMALQSYIAFCTGTQAIEWPLPLWIERAKFLSGGAEIILTNPEAGLSPSQTAQILEAERKGDCFFIPSAMLSTHFFLNLLRRIKNLSDQMRQITDMRDLIKSGEELQKELEFRTKALEREKDISTNIISSITSGLMIIDADGAVMMLNNEAIHILAAQRKDYLAAHFKDVFQPKISESIDRFISQVRETRSKISDPRVIIHEELILSWNCYPVFDNAGGFIGSLHLVEDTTRFELTERQLIQAEKLATIGTMLSGVAHELRNPLSIISGRVQRILEKKDKFDEWALRYLKSIDEQSIRCGHIVNNLLNLARRDTAGHSFHDANSMLDEALTYVDYQNIFDRIAVQKNYAKGAIIHCDRPQMIQVFLNLITNAADAMDGKGDLRLSTVVEAGRVIISVQDSGSGIDPKIQKKIFDPFFTTKEAGKGTGLGLPIVYRIVQQHGGDIRVRSKPGETVFDLILPVRHK